MKILIVCQHYWPEPFNVTDVAEGLVQKGHHVEVLTGLPNTGLPGNTVPEEYRHRGKRLEKRNGVIIRRAWMLPRRSGAFNRVLNYLSFWKSGNRMAKRLTNDYDVVIGYQFSPIMQVDPAIQVAKRNGTPFLLYCFDLWPESLTAGGFSRDSFAFKWMKNVSRRIYNEADTLAMTSASFEGYFSNELELRKRRWVYMPQYAEDFFGEYLELDEERSRAFLPSVTNLMFAGNVGAAQSVETIIRAAALLKGEPFCFHIVGSGSSLASCQSLVLSLDVSDMVVFHGRQPVEDMPAYYAKADAMLVTLAGGEAVGGTLPRKVQTYLAASRPVIGSLGGEGRRVLEDARCSVCCPAEDPDGLSEACRSFARLSDDEKRAMGDNAREYYNEFFSRERFFERLESELAQLEGTKHGE